MDPRFQPIVFNYLKKKKLTGKYSAFTIAGSAIGVTANKFKSKIFDEYKRLGNHLPVNNLNKKKIIVYKTI